MSVIPVSLLSRYELTRLGNNLRPCRRRPRRRRVLAAVNRSLAPLGERVAALHPASVPHYAAGVPPSAPRVPRAAAAAAWA